MTKLRGVCTIPGCGKLQQNKGKTKTGYQAWGKYCQKHNEEKHNYGNGRYTRHKKTWCQLCGKPDNPIGPSCLQVDHIDGNRNNNAAHNLQTLCYECHKLKTANNKDYLRKESLAILPGYE
tara:strand:- start:209 stop:571 length:363 start_codon:yes stop_codon:yes gene_type:complete